MILYGLIGVSLFWSNILSIFLWHKGKEYFPLNVITFQTTECYILEGYNAESGHSSLSFREGYSNMCHVIIITLKLCPQLQCICLLEFHVLLLSE
jgi:hypothetical protein